MSVFQQLLMSYGSAPFTPLSLPGLTNWYDAADSATRTLVSGKVSQWNDKSGNARHATQSTAADRYTLAAASVNGLDSFTGAGAAWMTLGAGGQVLQAPDFYAFVVGGSVNSCSFLNANSGNPAEYAMFPYSDGNFYGWSGGTGGDYLALTGIGASTTNGTINTMGVCSTSTGSWIGFGTHVNAAERTAPGGVGVGGLTGYPTDSSAWLNGNICEVIFGTATLTTTQRSNVVSYLKAKWGTA